MSEAASYKVMNVCALDNDSSKAGKHLLLELLHQHFCFLSALLLRNPVHPLLPSETDIICTKAKYHTSHSQALPGLPVSLRTFALIMGE